MFMSQLLHIDRTCCKTEGRKLSHCWHWELHENGCARFSENITDKTLLQRDDNTLAGNTKEECLRWLSPLL